MPANVNPVSDEREGLLAFLAQQRLVLRTAAYGLTDDQARQAPTRSSLTVGGLVKHVSRCEAGWMDVVLQRQPADDGDSSDYEDGFTLREGETLAGVLAEYEAVAAETERIIAGLDLDHAVPVPDAPWYPDDVEAWNVRWVLLHLIEETARHAGHADIVREEVDGATAFALLAAAEGWPATPWMQPWEPPVGAGA